MDSPPTNKKLSWSLAAILVVAIIGIGFLGYQYLFADRRAVACDKLPSVQTVQTTLTEHADTIRELEKLGPENTIRLEADATRCSGKADILIYYGTESQRAKIKQNIGDTFFGVPYRMANI